MRGEGERLNSMASGCDGDDDDGGGEVVIIHSCITLLSLEFIEK